MAQSAERLDSFTEFGGEAALVGGAGVNRNRGIRITKGHPLLASALRELKETFARTKGRY